MNEQILTGKKYRVLADEATGTWNRISFWNKAADTEMNDGTTVEKKVTDLTESLNSFSFGYTDDGKPGYKVGGADTVVPFSSGGIKLIWENENPGATIFSPITLNFDLNEYKYCIITTYYNSASVREGYEYLFNNVIPINNTDLALLSFLNSNYANILSRNIKIDTKQIIIGNGHDGLLGATISNNDCIPYQIFAVK